MTHPDQLSITSTAFDQWRKNRAKRSERTPLPLRQQGVLLYETYPSSKIMAALKISSTQLKNGLRSLIQIRTPQNSSHYLTQTPPL